MAMLKRGLPGYAEGIDDTAAPIFQFAPPGSQPPSGFGQLLGGQFQQAAENQLSSPATQAVAGALNQQDLMRRATAVATPPSALEHLYNFFAGDRASTDKLNQRVAVAQALSDPLVQQHLTAHPDRLQEAEANPAAFAVRTQDPDFIKEMQNARDTLAHVQANGSIHPEDQRGPAIIKDVGDRANDVARLASSQGLTPSQAHLGIEPHKFTVDEFARIFEGAPVDVVHTLFPQFARVESPQEKILGKHFGRLQESLDESHENYQNLVKEEADLAAKQNRKPVETKDIKNAKIERDKRRKAIIDAESALLGISGKEIPGQ